MSEEQRIAELEAALETQRRVTRQYAKALVDCDVVARGMGQRWGLCDCIDNHDQPYPSQWLADLLRSAANPVKPVADPLRLPTLEELTHA